MTEEGATGKFGKIVLWLVTIALGLAMIGAGSTKFVSAETWISMFEGWGYPAAFSYVIGVLEIVGAAAAFVPRFATYGATLVALIMCGAVFTLVTNPGEMGPLVPIVNVIGFGAIAYFRRNERWTP